MKTKKTEKNICETFVRGQKKYLVSITTPQKKRIKRYFDTLTLAREWLVNYKKSITIDISDFAQLSHNQIADIRMALNRLPTGYTLTQCVELVEKKYITSAQLKDKLQEFISIKENAQIADIGHVKSRLNKLINLTYETATSSKLIDMVHSYNLAPKTQIHYLNLWKEFFSWSATRGYIKESPFTYLHDSDLPKSSSSSHKSPTIETTKKFFSLVETKYPQYVGIFALVAFGGIRITEATRLNISNIDFEEREIIITKSISKTKRNWLQANMPDNVWEWIKKYPPNENWIKCDKNVRMKIYAYTQRIIAHNGLRHAFATYHLSMHRDSPKTSILMRHRNPDMLWQNYLEDLVSRKKAQEYFNILPSD
ncbi:MAG: hypothetical protein E7036_09640 [Opitutales bacterium]|nr:hypothetical protein [Opitutales bacterium]